MKLFILVSILLSCDSVIEPKKEGFILELSDSMKGFSVVAINKNDPFKYETPFSYNNKDSIIITYINLVRSTMSVKINNRRKIIICKFAGKLEMSVYKNKVVIK